MLPIKPYQLKRRSPLSSNVAFFAVAFTLWLLPLIYAKFDGIDVGAILHVWSTGTIAISGFGAFLGVAFNVGVAPACDYGEWVRASPWRRGRRPGVAIAPWAAAAHGSIDRAAARRAVGRQSRRRGGGGGDGNPHRSARRPDPRGGGADVGGPSRRASSAAARRGGGSNSAPTACSKGVRNGNSSPPARRVGVETRLVRRQGAEPPIPFTPTRRNSGPHIRKVSDFAPIRRNVRHFVLPGDRLLLREHRAA